MKKTFDKKVPSISRRDFVGGTLIGSGVALLTALAPRWATAKGRSKAALGGHWHL